MVLDYLDYSVFTPVCKGDLPDVKSPNAQECAREIKRAMDRNQPIFVYGDYDGDGMFSMLVFKEVLYSLKYKKVKFFQYKKRTHAIDPEILQQAAGFPLVVICDTGSSLEDKNVLALLELQKSRVVVIDHHQCGSRYVGASGNVRFYNAYEESHLLGGKICGAYAALLVAKYLCEELCGNQLSLPARVYALAAMYADQMDMSTPPARALYNNVSKYDQEGPALVAILNEWGYKPTRRLFSFIIAPKINACFRSEKFQPLNAIVAAPDRFSVQSAVKKLKDVHNSVSKLVEPWANSFTCENFGQITLATVEPTLEMVSMHIRNFTGLIANYLANRDKCAVITVVNENNYYRGSYRDFFDRPLLDDCALFMTKAGGHPPAFGLEFTDIENVRRHLRILSDKMQRSVSSEQLTISSSLVTTMEEVSTLALYNEYMTTRPKANIKHTCRNVKCIRSTNYSKLFKVGLPAPVKSKRTIVEGEPILVEPCLTSRIELRLIE